MAPPSFGSLHGIFSGTMKASPQGGSFRSDLAQGFLDPVFEAHCVFIKKDLSSSSERQPRATSIAYNVLGVSCTTWTNDSKGGFSCLLSEFLVRWSMALGGNVISPHGKFSPKLYMYRQTYIYYV